MTQTDPDRQKVLSDMAAGFDRPLTPTEFQITVGQAAADRVQATSIAIEVIERDAELNPFHTVE